MLTLPQRPGDRPRTRPVIPHQQLSQNAPPDIQEKLWQKMISLEHVIQGPSHVSLPDTRALHLDPDYAHGAAGSLMIGTEFAHLHGQRDGSLHIVLPPDLAAEVMRTGWGEPHPIVRDQPHPTLLMLFGPRDDYDLSIIWQLVQASHANATGGVRTTAS